MNQNLTVSQGQQKQAVDDLQQGLTQSINPGALQQSSQYAQGSQNQVANNQGQFGTVLNAVGNNVRGVIDPAALKQSGAAATNEVMTPEQEREMVMAAGISAGARNQAAVGDLERAAAAAGSSPEGIAAYRARMQQQTAVDAANAQTQARVAAQQARAGEALSSEQQRLGAQQGLTGIQTSTEMGMGQEALAGTEQLGQQALTQANTVEQNRQQAQQYLTGAQLQAATTGGEAAMQQAEIATAQQQQQAQYAASTGTGIAQAQDVANANRAATIAGNRQQTQVGNEATAFGQGNTVAQETAAAGQNIGNARMAQQQAGLGLQAGTQATQAANQQGAYGRQQQTYATQAGATNQAAGLGLAASQTPTTTDKVVGGVTGFLGGLAGGGFLEEGGVATEPTLAVLGEDEPEMVVPLGGTHQPPGMSQNYRAYPGIMRHPNPKVKGKRFYGEREELIA
jgi:hypothetical protein